MQLENAIKESNAFGETYNKLVEGMLWKQVLEETVRRMPELASVQLARPGSALTGRSINFDHAFFVTDDHRALVLEATFVSSNAASEPMEIRVVGAGKREGTNPPDWGGAEYSLPSELADQFSEALRIYFRLFDKASNFSSAVGQRTFRYQEGGRTRYERGTPIAEFCGRSLFRNVLGVFILAHVTNHASIHAAACADIYDSEFKTAAQ